MESVVFLGGGGGGGGRGGGNVDSVLRFFPWSDSTFPGLGGGGGGGTQQIAFPYAGANGGNGGSGFAQFGSFGLNFSHNIQSSCNFSKDGMLSIQPRSLTGANKELTSVGVGS